MSGFDLSKLINESSSPLDHVLAASRGLSKKWEKTGLLDGLKTDIDRGNMAVMLENQARQLVTETSRTGTAANAEQWSGVALPLVRKVFGEISAKEFVSVQPMNLPSGLIFYMDFQYGTGVAPRTIGDSVYGDTTSSLAPQGGLYGAGKFGYSINNVTSSFAVITSNTTATSASVNYSTTPSGLCELTVPLTSLSGADATAVRSFVPSGAFWTTYFPQFTRLDANQVNVVFVVAGTGSLATVGKVTYTKQPAATSRGDFEDTIGSSIPPTGVDIGIPEINISLRSIPIVPKTRKLKAVWTPELSQDLNAYHSVDAEAELTAMLSEYISLEIDLELLEMLLLAAQTTNYWSAQIGTVWNGTAFVADANISGQAWTTMTWYQTLGNVMQKTSNTIHQLTLRGGANFAVVSPSVASIIESIPGFAAKTDGNQVNFAMGVSQVGSFQNRFQIYKNPYLTSNVMLMGFRGSNFLETGAVYAPYIPLIMTPLVYDPQNFTPRRGVLTRYAKQVVRNEFFAKILIANLPA
jgi:hypothetical protein